MSSTHLSICINRGFHSKAPLSPKHSCITSDFLPKHQDQHPWEVGSSRKTIPAPLDFRGYKSPSSSVTRETVQDTELGPLPTSSQPSPAQGKQVAVIHSTLRFFNQGGHRSPHCQDLWICSRDCSSLKIYDQLYVCSPATYLFLAMSHGVTPLR